MGGGCPDRSSGRHLGKGAPPIPTALSCLLLLLPWIAVTAPTPAWPGHSTPCLQSPKLYFKSAKCKSEPNYITPRPSVAPHCFRVKRPLQPTMPHLQLLFSLRLSPLPPRDPGQITVNSLGVPSLCHFLQANTLPLVNLVSTTWSPHRT